MLGTLFSPFPCDQNRLTEAGPEIQICNTTHQVTLTAASLPSTVKTLLKK
jgi:hypothetical protein